MYTVIAWRVGQSPDRFTYRAEADARWRAAQCATDTGQSAVVYRQLHRYGPREIVAVYERPSAEP